MPPPFHLLTFTTLTTGPPDALVAAHAAAEASRLGALRSTGLPGPAGHPGVQPQVPQRAGHLAGGVEGGGGGGRAGHGCQIAIARLLDCMCLALRASGIWLHYPTPQN